MKIDNGSLPPTPDRIGTTPGVSSGDAQRTSTARPVGTDAVAVSSDAHLVAAAVGQIRDLGDVRPDVVARAREAIARGEVGADAERLADRLIDGLLDRGLADE